MDRRKRIYITHEIHTGYKSGTELAKQNKLTDRFEMLKDKRNTGRSWLPDGWTRRGIKQNSIAITSRRRES